jgi:predicted nucleotidyltransferase
MDERINITIESYLRIIRQKYSGIERAFVFGSYAKGKPDLNSDIDIAVIFKDLKESERFDIQVQLMLIASQIDSRIEPHPISLNDFISGNSFINEIQRTGIEIIA